MKKIKLARAEWPAAPRTKESKIVALIYAAILTIMLFLQLFSFEKFVPLIESYNLPGGSLGAILLSCFIVICELLALPFLLRMRLSLLMRWCSMIAGWLVPLLWLMIAFGLAFGSQAGIFAILGASVNSKFGLWSFFMVLVLGLLAVWSSWGMWPTKAVFAKRKRAKS